MSVRETEEMNILIAYGTRPEYNKLRPLLDKLKGLINYKLLFTGQHIDLVPEINPDYRIEIKDGKNRLNSIMESILNCDENIFENISHVMILGDTTTTLAIAINSFHRKIPLIHIEAGARTYDIYNPYPEELNRQVISRMTSIHFCPTEVDRENLKREMCSGEFHVVGQTGMDNLKHIIPTYGNKILITLHRRENHVNISEYFTELNILAGIYNDLEFILPIHPSPNVYKHKDLLKNVNVIKPLDHKKLIDILADSRFVITDSGGIMDEACFLNKKVIVPRKIIENEKRQMIDKCFYMCSSPKHLHSLFKDIYEDYKINIQCPFGDGNASSKIYKVLEELL